MSPVTLFQFSQNGVPKWMKKAVNWFVNNLKKFWKFTVLSISRLGGIEEVWYTVKWGKVDERGEVDRN